MFGSCISYQIIITQLLQFVINALTNNEHATFINDIKFRACQGIPTAMIVLFPLSLIKDMSGFRYVSFASIIALFYTGIVLLAELPSYIN
jgi:amino acid permease